MCRNASTCGCDNAVNEARRWNICAVISSTFPILKKINASASLESLSRSAHTPENAKALLYSKYKTRFDKTWHDTWHVHHQRYSPDLSLSDFYLLPKIRTTLKEHKFQDVKIIKKMYICWIFKHIFTELRNVFSEFVPPCTKV